MNPWQLAQQMKADLEAAVWPSGAGDPVFGADCVHVYTGPPNEDAIPPEAPFALITIDDYTADPDEPSLIEQTFTIGVAVDVRGDLYGSNAILGSAISGIGQSQGRGSAEVKARAQAVVQELTGADGASIVVSGQGGSGPTLIGRRNMVFEQFRVSALCTTHEVYTAPQKLQIVGNVIKWDGSQCSRRFDFLQYRVGFVSGDTPASSPSAFSSTIFTGTAIETAFTPSPGRTYSVFADYDPRGTGTAEATSADVVGSWVTT